MKGKSGGGGASEDDGWRVDRKEHKLSTTSNHPQPSNYATADPIRSGPGRRIALTPDEELPEGKENILRHHL